MPSVMTASAFAARARSLNVWRMPRGVSRFFGPPRTRGDVEGPPAPPQVAAEGLLQG